MAILAKDVVRHWKDKSERQFSRDSFLFVTALISLFVLLAKGVIGARFHLFYFLSFAVASSKPCALWSSILKTTRENGCWWFLFYYGERTQPILRLGRTGHTLSGMSKYSFAIYFFPCC